MREALGAGVTLEVESRLRSSEWATWETVVRARRDDAEPLRVELSRVETHEVVGTQGDPLRVVMLLPGVTGVASGLSSPVVRGTQPSSTGFFLDGVRVPPLYPLLAGPSVINPSFIDSVDVFVGALPASVGRLLGGAVVSVDRINAGAFVSASIDAWNPKVSAAARVSDTPLIGAAVVNAVLPSTPQRPQPTSVVDWGGDRLCAVRARAPAGARRRQQRRGRAARERR